MLIRGICLRFWGSRGLVKFLIHLNQRSAGHVRDQGTAPQDQKGLDHDLVPVIDPEKMTAIAAVPDLVIEKVAKKAVEDDAHVQDPKKDHRAEKGLGLAPVNVPDENDLETEEIEDLGHDRGQGLENGQKSRAIPESQFSNLKASREWKL